MEQFLRYEDFKALYEAKATEDILTSSLKEYGKVSKELEDLYNSIKEKTAKLEKDKKDLFDKILGEMETSNKNLVVVDKIVAEIKTVKGKSRTNPKYKEAFTLALTKVNEATKTVLNEALKANTTFTEAVDKNELNIKIAESALTDVWKKVKKFFVDIYKDIKSAVSDQSKAVKDLEKSFEKVVSLNESYDFIDKDGNDIKVNSTKLSVNVNGKWLDAIATDFDGDSGEIEVEYVDSKSKKRKVILFSNDIRIIK